jgi:hypothetical protein
LWSSWIIGIPGWWRLLMLAWLWIIIATTGNRRLKILSKGATRLERRWRV